MSVETFVSQQARRVRGSFEGLQESRAYDLAMRLPLLCWSIFCLAALVNGLRDYVRSADPRLPEAVYAIDILMRLSAIAFLVLLAASVILRVRPEGKARGLEPRVSALAGTLVVYTFALFPRRELPLAGEIAATMLTLIGSAASVFVLAQLGRSFSVMAEARRLVTAGVYRFVRHPLYLAEELATLGIFMQFCSAWTALLLIAQIGFQLRRMHNEERVLAKAFPEYAEYQAETARLIPGVY
jgi:protein-S-isoprenylcysteine O-methyltransferase Ste14